MSNRQSRRQAHRQNGKLQGETMAEAIQRKKRTMAACGISAILTQLSYHKTAASTR